jgi:hypothetical protein
MTDFAIWATVVTIIAVVLLVADMVQRKAGK